MNTIPLNDWKKVSIFKYVLLIQDWQNIAMPQGAKIFSAQIQRGEICVWALVDTQAPLEERQFHIVGTGHPARHVLGCKFIDTVQPTEALVFHVFEGPGGLSDESATVVSDA